MTFDSVNGSRVSLFQALRNLLGQDLRSITSNEIEAVQSHHHHHVGNSFVSSFPFLGGD
ncbi:hypothetical protein LguiA_001581 [Lonicera macranthoides]